MRRIAFLVSLAFGSHLFAGLALAHHSQAGIFDSGKTVEVSGVVKSVSWRNPHGQILLSVKNDRIKLNIPGTSAGIYIAVLAFAERFGETRSEMPDAIISKKIFIPAK